ALARARYVGREGTREVRREHPVAAKVVMQGEASIVRGTIDRLVIGVVNDRPVWAEILDFKTDAVDQSRSAEFAERVAHYEPQMAAYVRTIAASLRLDPSAVSASLLFVGSDSVVKVASA
ncbi:MAG: PD-(D/E)XK nuclease family protein, partial [bacterium]|nr:PD-(D/E)XK nuclease family protein [bacterium]